MWCRRSRAQTPLWPSTFKETKRCFLAHSWRFVTLVTCSKFVITTSLYKPIKLVKLKGLAQAKIINKSVILFWLLYMTIWCKNVYRLELQKFSIFCARHSPVRLDIETKFLISNYWQPCQKLDIREFRLTTRVTRKQSLQNFMKIGWELTEKSAENMRYKLFWRLV